MEIHKYDLPALGKSVKPTYKYGSSTYLVLAYAYAYRTSLTIDDFQRLSSNAFEDKYTIKRALGILVDNKAMTQVNDTYWCITGLGIRQAVELAKSNKKNKASSSHT